MRRRAINAIFCLRTHFESKNKKIPEVLKTFRKKKENELTEMFLQHRLSKNRYFYCCYSKRNNNRKDLIQITSDSIECDTNCIN